MSLVAIVDMQMGGFNYHTNNNPHIYCLMQTSQFTYQLKLEQHFQSEHEESGSAEQPAKLDLWRCFQS